MRKYLKTILLICLCFSGEFVSAQNITITTGDKSKSLLEILTAIENQSDYLFVYDNSKIELEQRFKINESNKTIKEILDILFRDNTKITYEVSKKSIILKNVSQKNISSVRNTRDIIGQVIDSDGNPVVGAVVQVKGANIGTVVDVNGNFKLQDISKDAILLVSCISYRTQTIDVAKSFSGKIILKEDVQMLTDVVVVGYGQMQSKEITSSIVSISSDQIMKGIGGADLTSALQGKISGLVIGNSKGVNDSPVMQLRGMASIASGQQPLVVIDGFPGGDIRSVNPNDVQSIDVLKDASASAIYGTRAAAGVIMITTKSGTNTESKLDVTYSGEILFKQSYRKPQVMSAEEYVEHNVGHDYGSSIDWWEQCINRRNFSQKHNVSLGFGTDKAKIYSSLYYENQEGISIGEWRKDYGGRINAKFILLKGWLEVQTNVDYRQAKRNNQRPNFGQALLNNPTRNPYDDSSRSGYNIWIGEDNDFNVLADALLYDNNSLDKWFKPGILLKLNILPVKGLTYQQSLGYSDFQYEIHTYKSMMHRENILNSIAGTATLGFSKTYRVNTEGYFSYDNSFSNHKINAILGYSYNNFGGESFSMSNSNFSVDGIKYWDIGKGSYLNEGLASMSSNKRIAEKLLAYFTRINYSYDNRYLISATYRREGSSKFGKKNRWGNFWAVSGGWSIANEPFMANIDCVDELKIRVGYGVTGNNDFSAAYSGNFISADENRWLLENGQWKYAYGRSEDVNHNLQWEQKGELNIGLDFSLFRGRLYGKFDLFKRNISNLLFYVMVPQPPYIRGYQWQNIGSMVNKGWEFELGGDLIRTKNFTWNTSINLSASDSKVLKMDGGSTRWDGGLLPGPNSPGKSIILSEGSKIGQFYLYEFAGFTQDGQFKINNRNGQVVSASSKIADDRKLLGNFTPALMLGWNHTLKYRNFDLGINMHGWFDFDVLNTYTMTLGIPKRNGECNALKQAYTTFSHIKDEKLMSNYYLEDGSFLKIDALTLGYDLDLSKYTDNYLQDIRLYFTVGNLFTFTRYTGLDPEIDIIGYEGGIDDYSKAYPMSRTFCLGLQLKF